MDLYILNWFLTKVQKQFSGETVIFFFSKNGAGTIDIYVQAEHCPYLAVYAKTNTKWIMNLSIKS